MYENNLAFATYKDQEDPLKNYRKEFLIPTNNEGIELVYLCGNSLGLQPKKTSNYLQQELNDWAKFGVEGHTDAKNPWLPYHEFLTNSMAKIVGAKPSEIVIMNSLTTNLHLMMVSFYQPTKSKYKIVIESDAFPSDKYAMESQLKFHGYDSNDGLILWKPREGENLCRFEDLEKIMEDQGDEIALLMIGSTNYYSGQLYPLKKITELGHKHNSLVGFDLAHGVGNIQPNLHETGVDFAVWCTYKYLNSGPGSLGGCFVHERHANNTDLNRFAGWWGHNKQTRFNMRHEFDAIPGAEGWQLSNAPVLGMAAHLAGAVAAHSTRPVIGIPIESGGMGGMDSLLSTAMMPPGVPVATVAVGKAGAKNSAILAVQILATSDAELSQKLHDYKNNMREEVLKKDKALNS